MKTLKMDYHPWQASNSLPLCTSLYDAKPNIYPQLFVTGVCSNSNLN